MSQDEVANRQESKEHTQIGDIGLEHLNGMTELGCLLLRGTQVSDEGVEKLQDALPNCDILH